jgi:hypothetical protein
VTTGDLVLDASKTRGDTRAGALGSRVFGLLAVTLSALVYFPVTGSYFREDDFLFLLRVVDQPLRDLLLEPFGGHVLIVRNAVFALTFELFGLDPRPFYWSLYLTHLLNVWLLFRVLDGATGRAALACLGATLWGTSPLHAASVGWYAVYGQLLAATALLVVLGQLVRRRPDQPPSVARVLVWATILLAGASCFGVGLGVGLVFPLVAVLMAPRVTARPARTAVLLLVPLAVAGLYLWAFRHLPTQMAGLKTTLFTHWILVAIMTAHLFAYGMAALILGFPYAPIAWQYVATGYPSILSDVVVGVSGALLASALWLGDARARRQLLAALALAIGIYGSIAIGRATYHPNFTIAGAAGQGRYHYVGMIPLAMLLCLSLGQLESRLPRRALSAEALLALWLVVGIAGWAHSSWRIETHAAAREWTTATLRALDAAVDRTAVGATVYLENGAAPLTVRGYVIDQIRFPGRAVPFVLTYGDDTVRGRHVRFLERDPRVVRWYRERGGRLAQLLVGPHEVPR